MADGYVKILSSILDSSIWAEPDDVVRVWITMLAMADRDGYVGASAGGIAARTRTVSRARVLECLDMFSRPDTDSRSQDYDGCRIQRVERGWLILNYKKIRDMHGADATRKRKRDWWRNNRGKASKLESRLDHSTSLDPASQNPMDLDPGSGSGRSLPTEQIPKDLTRNCDQGGTGGRLPPAAPELAIATPASHRVEVGVEGCDCSGETDPGFVLAPAPATAVPPKPKRPSAGQPGGSKRHPEIPIELPATWSPSQTQADALATRYAVPPDRITACVPEFRVYWREGKGAGTRRGPKGWGQTFAGWIRRQAESGGLYAEAPKRGGRRGPVQKNAEGDEAWKIPEFE